MTVRILLHPIAACLLALTLSSGASATLLAEWNFNAASGPNLASAGTGTTSGGFFPFNSALPERTGSPNDAAFVEVNGGPNNSSAGRSGPNPLEAPGTRPFTILTSTVGFAAPTVTWDFLQGYRASRYYQLVATADGTNFGPLPAGGTGSSISGPYGSASIDDSGLITIETIDGLIDDNNGTGYMHDLSYTFPAGTAYDNNPQFGVRIYATWDPAGSDFVSSFAGTTSAADPASGYIRNTALGGNQIRYDLIRVTAVPEPACIGLLACGIALGIARRRK